MMLAELRLFDHHGHALRFAEMITVTIGHSMVVQASPARGCRRAAMHPAHRRVHRLYLAYHEGRGGYRRGTWKHKPGLLKTARRVAETARRYQQQLAQCEARYRCDAWYQVWPFCR